MFRNFTLFDLALIGQKTRGVVDIVISTAVQNYNLWTAASSSPNYVAGKTDINLTISNTIGSSTVDGNSLSVPNQFTTGDIITITNNSTVIGRGGNGGRGGLLFTFATPGESVPGSAISVAYPVTIINNGTFAGGGGGGGGGSPRQPVPGGTLYGGGGGGGGAGSPGGFGGDGTSPAPGPTPFIGAPGGSPGTLTSGGAGGTAAGGATPGGPGGGQGADGTTAPGTPNSPPPQPGGTRGLYASGNPLITWQVTGTRLGRVS